MHGITAAAMFDRLVAWQREAEPALQGVLVAGSYVRGEQDALR